MAMALEPFAGIGLDGSLFGALLEEHDESVVPALERLWGYYRNPRVSPGREGASALAQAEGLPARLRGRPGAGADDRDRPGEVVIENDIGWRIDAMVDFVFGKPIRFVSTASDERVRREVEAIVDRVFESSGGGALLRDAGLLGAVHGHVDFLVRAERAFEQGPAPGGFDGALERAGDVRVEIVEAARGVPVLDPSDYRVLLGYLIVCDEQTNEVEATASGPRRRVSRVVEVLGAGHRQVYRDGALIEDSPSVMGVLPVVHVQDTSEPFSYAGRSEVEPLIPTQDELNTRLSDRAHRVTLQSFKMYLAKGIEGFGRTPVGPGQVWSTENESAQVESFGGDMHAPSEDAHIEELREAMDKISSVSPVVIGVIRERLGQLSSENALRVTMTGILAKTERKRIAYGRALSRVCELVLSALDESGVHRTDPGDRGVRVIWPDPIPVDRESELRSAARKIELGIPQERVLAELGYGTGDTGVI